MEQMELEKDIQTKELTLNMGPQHPATHGVLRLALELDGEIVVKCTPHIGYLHRGIEKLAEDRTYPTALPLTDRLDYVASMTNNIGYCTAIERLFGVEVPERAKFLRTIVAEMTRISSHLLWLATHALDIGAMTLFLYCFREREWILDLFEILCGARLTVSYPRIGGVMNDASPQFFESLNKFTEILPQRIVEYETLIDRNRIWLKRTKGIGVISSVDALRLGLTGPTLRGSGVPYDVRKHEPYDAYDKVDFEVPVGKNGDVYDRYRCRMEELLQSNWIIRQCLEKIPDGSILSDISPDIDMPEEPGRKLIPEISLMHASISFALGYEISPDGEFYSAVEAPKGELGFFVIGDGTARPFRMRIRAPSFVHIAALPKLCKGLFIADVIAVIGSIDIVLGECDR